MARTLVYQRVLLKISGEMLQGDAAFGLDPAFLTVLAEDIKALVAFGVQVGVVVGGGNFCRGDTLSERGNIDRVTADHLGMLATMMNGLALRDAFLAIDQAAQVFSARELLGVLHQFEAGCAKEALTSGSVVILVGGTGNPFFTTDTAASLRAIELDADILIKATKVDGVYSADPHKHKNATRYDRLSFDEVLSRELGVMDLSAICMCKTHNLPIRVVHLKNKEALLRLVCGEDVGTLVDSGDKI